MVRFTIPVRLQKVAGTAATWLAFKDNSLKLAVIACYAVLVIAEATTSSIGMAHLRQDPSDPLGVQIGNARQIRSDEYNAFSPIALSIMATGAAPTLSELGARADIVHRFTSGGFFESFVFFDSAILKTATFLPDGMVFAAHWWLPMLLLLVMMPKWFEQVGGTRRMGWLAAGLIALSPSVAWWSMMPVALLAYTLTGSSLMLSAYRRFNEGQRLIPWVQVAIGGILIAGIPSFYIPWSLVLGLPVLTASALWILTRPGGWWPRLRPVVYTGVIAALFGAGTLLENAAGLQALLGTVYPGSRRSSATAQPFALLFGAPALAPMENGATPTGTNASELSTSFTISFVWALALVGGGRFVRNWRSHVASGTVLVFGMLWLGWTLVNLGTAGEKIPLFNYVPAVRVAQVVGVLGVIAACLFLSSTLSKPGWRVALVAGFSSGAVTAYAAAQLQQSFLPEVRISGVVAASVGVAVSVVFVTKYPRQVWPVALALVLAAIPVYRANPLIFGLGDLRNSSTARALYEDGRAARADGSSWASNMGPFDTVMLANGVPSLSGLQRSGPDKAVWQKLDPRNAYEDAWNRAGGYIPFSWKPGQPTKITTNGFDVTFVEIDPCELKKLVPSLGHIASTEPLAASCLSFDKTLTWAGRAVSIYTTH